jgi:ABC-type nickel/cobalt efflux system permease component RcnA
MAHTVTLTLVAAAISLGSMHAVAPDHWMPFAALARAERWSARRTVLLTAVCGLGHVTVSVVLGLVALVCGLELLHALGARLESASGLLLAGFGVAYGIWGWHRAMTERRHTQAHALGQAHAHLLPHQHHHHHHDHYDRDALHRPLTAWTLFLLFSADPCVAVIPLVFAAVPLGWATTLAIVISYELATIGTMIVFVLPARAVAAVARGAWIDSWADALAGGVVAVVGLVVASLGI